MSKTDEKRKAWFFSGLQLLGGIILSAGYIPQIAQIVRTGLTRDLNLVYLVSIFVGVVFMEVYAIYLISRKSAYAFFVTNTLSLMLAGVMVALKVMFG